MNPLLKAQKLIPWAAQTRSKSYKRFPSNWPRMVSRGVGCYVSSNEDDYLDFISALGPMILGYGNQQVDKAVINQIRRGGTLFSLPHELEAEVAGMLNEIIPCAEMVLFLKNGGDSTAAAVRLAKQVTGRPIVMNRGYHGWFVFDQVKNFDSIEPLRGLFHKFVHQIAGVLIEPELFSKEELTEIRDICTKEGIILIFDEVISGFRIALGGMQEYTRVIPDLACFSKAMANGYPLSALVGKKQYMKRLEQDVFVSTTFGGDCIGLAACKATIQQMRKHNVIDYLWELGLYLEKELKKIIEKYDFPMKLYGYPPMIHFKMPDDIHQLFLQEIIKHHIMIYNNHNLTFAHSAYHLRELLAAYEDIFPRIMNGEVELETKEIQDTQTFRQWR